MKKKKEQSVEKSLNQADSCIRVAAALGCSVKDLYLDAEKSLGWGQFMKKKEPKKLAQKMDRMRRKLGKADSCIRVVIKSLTNRPEYAEQDGLISETTVLENALKQLDKAWDLVDKVSLDP